VNFFEILADKVFEARHYKDPKNKMQKIENLNFCLTFYDRELKLRNPGCSAENIHDCDENSFKNVLGLLFTLYREFRMKVEVDTDEPPTGKKIREEDALLNWARKVCKPYNVDIANYRTGFTNGQAFLCLCHAYDKEKFPFNHEDHINKQPKELLEFTFDFASKNMSIQSLLEIDEVVKGEIDDRALAIYLSLFHHAYKAKRALDKMEKRHLKETDALQSELKSKEELIKQNMEMSEELERLNERNKQKQAEIDKIKKDIAELEKRIAEKKARVVELNGNKIECQKNLKKNDDKIRELENERNRLLKEFEELEKKHNSLQEKEGLVNDEYDKLKIEYERIKSELQVQKDVQAGEDVKEKFIEEEKKLKLLEQEIETMHVKGNELEEVQRNLKKQIDELVERKDLNDKKIKENNLQAAEFCMFLKIFCKNLRIHVDDLTRWEEKLDGKASIVDVGSEIKGLRMALEQKVPKEQFYILLKLLEQEKITMKDLFKEKTKVQFSPEAGAAAKKKPVAKKK